MKEHWGRFIALLSLIAIALGSFNDSMDALERIYDFSLAQFTDIPSQNKLDKIYIRASDDVLDDTLGSPVYIKRSFNDNVIKYYQDDRFILSAVIKDNAIAAYLVFPAADFSPDTSLSAGGERLLQQPFSALEGVSDLRASFSAVITYYIEENTGGEFNNLYTSISGYSLLEQSLSHDNSILLENLVDALTLGEDVNQIAQNLRQNLIPNFYGYSTLGLSDLEDAILTISEYKLITH